MCNSVMNKWKIIDIFFLKMFITILQRCAQLNATGLTLKALKYPMFTESVNWFLLQDQEDIHVHRFKRGWKLEALNPLARNQICPATVVKVLDSRYFVVEIDSLTEESYPIRFSCHARSRFIFPCGWCKKNNIAVTPPKGKYACT